MLLFFEDMIDIEKLLENQISVYPNSQVEDILKALYQAILGCGHLVKDEEECKKRFYKELENTQIPSKVQKEELLAYSRVHLSALKDLGISPDTLLKLFILSAQSPVQSEEYNKALEMLPELCERGVLPFSQEEMSKVVEKHRQEGCPALHHSKVFSESYHPAYRIIKSDFADLIPLLGRIEGLLKTKERAIIAIDGNSASGKSTLTELLQKLYNADIIHMDDYFLPPELKSAERLATAGGNTHYERFLKELLSPLSQGKEFTLRPYRCHGNYYEEPIKKIPERLTVIEGSYALHPKLAELYDLKIFIELEEELQRQRIKQRNPDMYDRFINEWIPLENKYFKELCIPHSCHIHLRSKKNFRFDVKDNL